MELYMTVRQLAFGGESSGKKRIYHNELVENTASALAQAPDFLAPFRQAVREAARSARLPALIHIDFDDISEGGVYDWTGVKELLSREIGWVDAPDSGKGLHTSCKIERMQGVVSALPVPEYGDLYVALFRHRALSGLRCRFRLARPRHRGTQAVLWFFFGSAAGVVNHAG